MSSATVYGVARQNFSLQADVGTTHVYYDTTTTLIIQPDVYYLPRTVRPKHLRSIQIDTPFETPMDQSFKYRASHSQSVFKLRAQSTYPKAVHH